MKYLYRKNIWIYLVVTVFVLPVITSGCKKEKDQLEILELRTNPAHSVTPTRAAIECVVINGTGTKRLWYGFCWSTSPRPAIHPDFLETMDSNFLLSSHSYNKDKFTGVLKNLIPDTKYYVRSFATDENRVVYGNEISFKTDIGTIGTVKDIDGNVYHTVIIGDQVWMVENMKTTKYRNGDPILHIVDSSQWDTLTRGAYCYYNNDLTNDSIYGKLYNWFAVNDSRNLAPEGWHVSTDADWFELVRYLSDLTGADAETIACRLIENGKEHWENGSSYLSNEFGFTALPGGFFDGDGFHKLRQKGYWWSSTEYYPGYAYYWCLYARYCEIFRNTDIKTNGYSVRCVKDKE